MNIASATAIATASVAILLAIVTWREWATNRARLRHELFERRYAVYERIAASLALVLRDGRVPQGEPEGFLRATKTAYFVFGSDLSVKAFVSEVYRKALELHALEVTLDPLRGEERSKNIEDQRVIKDWFMDSLNSLEARFDKYLSLKH